MALDGLLTTFVSQQHFPRWIVYPTYPTLAENYKIITRLVSRMTFKSKSELTFAAATMQLICKKCDRSCEVKIFIDMHSLPK